MMIWFGLRPVDSWVLRDATPLEGFFLAPEGFNIFPPTPFTIAGAFRAAVARVLGWDGGGDWSGESRIREVVGSGPEDTGRLRFMGPLVRWRGELVFPGPWSVRGVAGEEGQWQPAVLARPGREELCDMGRVRLPEWEEPEGEKLEPPEGWWITSQGMGRLLVGELPSSEHFIRASYSPGAERWLWSEQDRVGIAIDPETGAAARGMIYGCRYLRLNDDVEVVVGVEGLEPSVASQLKQRMFITMGGKARIGLVRELGNGGDRPSLDLVPGPPREVARPMVVVLTPLGPLGEQWWRGRLVVRVGQDDIRLKIVCGCCPRPVRIGGWSFREGSRAKRSYLPGGSVIFCEYEGGPKRLSVGEAGRCRVEGGDDLGDLGFGTVLIGEWTERRDG